MPREVRVVTTKPQEDIAEYGVWDTDKGDWVLHGVVIPQNTESLPAAKKLKIKDARDTILEEARSHARAVGHIPA